MAAMKKYGILVIVLQLYANAAFTDPVSGFIPLQENAFEHIQFKRIEASNYKFENGQLVISVNSSASLLMKPFSDVREIKTISLEWKSDKKPAVKDSDHEKIRSGDDAVFKVGLLLKADSKAFKPFIPSWMKRVDELLAYPSEEMLYMVVDSRHAEGERWENPYNERVTMIALYNGVSEDGWQKASYQFDVPVNVVAIWLMSDGDNTGSSFVAQIKNIEIN